MDHPDIHLRKISGDDVFGRRTPDEDGAWTATQVELDGRTYTGTASFVQAAILALIADRMGFTAVIEPEDDET